MAVNRKELARRIAHRGGFNIGDVEKVLEIFEDVIVDTLNEGDSVKLGKLLKIFLEELPEKNAFDGLNKRYFIREAKRVPKVKLLTRLSTIELPAEKKDTEG
ncbi:DNA binding protein [Bacillus phage vB_BmeM-Goe8]|uniref:Putative DNA binding protein n=1 Tax=Bacillus phage vB_BmeM-Goe8 TaxID=2593638 RepID=A0A516KMU3_9CAUD|nr:DNA binding protein [Bacillus phage vB_BmeM-Goe8]QDP42900.1 putative DNA binding protein [Bacillus phage vB_BmeM-Goe8]